jgi:hypothetical protein
MAAASPEVKPASKKSLQMLTTQNLSVSKNTYRGLRTKIPPFFPFVLQ